MSKNNTKKPIILIIDDKKRFPDKLKLLSEYSFIHVGLHKTDIVSIIEEIDNMEKNDIDIILLDLEFKQDEGISHTSQEHLIGLNLITPIKERFSNIPIIITTVYGDLDITRKCLRMGADNFLRKDKFEELQWRKIFDIYIENKRLKIENQRLRKELTQIHEYPTESI